MARRMLQSQWDAKRAEAKANARALAENEPEDDSLTAPDDSSEEQWDGNEEELYEEYEDYSEDDSEEE